MSFPHFFNADPILLDQVEGLKPDKDKHEFFMAFEPVRNFLIPISNKFANRPNYFRKLEFPSRWQQSSS